MRESGAGTLDTHEHHAERGFWGTYVFSTDHKMIGKQYLSLGLFWAVVGGLLAHVMRWQLAWPDTAVPGWGEVGPETYNVLVTMHGTIMVFFVAMPILLGAFGNFLIPLMIGARDMAFPRLNMLSVWVFALASLVLLVSFFVPGGAASAGWTGYPPLSAKVEYTGVNWGLNLWILAHALEFAAFLMGGVNYLTTAIALRGPRVALFPLPPRTPGPPFPPPPGPAARPPPPPPLPPPGGGPLPPGGRGGGEKGPPGARGGRWP